MYKGCTVVTAHWIDNDWNLQSIMLEFGRFRTPHTGEAPKAFLRNGKVELELSDLIQAETTDNASDMIKGMSLLHN